MKSILAILLAGAMMALSSPAMAKEADSGTVQRQVTVKPPVHSGAVQPLKKQPTFVPKNEMPRLKLKLPQLSLDMTSRFILAIKSLPPEKRDYITLHLSRIASRYEDVASYMEIYLHLPLEYCSAIVSGGGSADGSLMDRSRCEFLVDQSREEFKDLILANLRLINIKYRFEVIEKSLNNVSSDSPYLPEFIEWCNENIDYSASMKEFNNALLSRCQALVDEQDNGICLTGNAGEVPNLLRELANGLKSIVSGCSGG